MYGWVIGFVINCIWKQMSYRVTFAYRYWSEISWLMKTCSEFSLHLRDAANKVIQIVHVHMQTSGVRFFKTVNINFIDNLPTFPFTESLWTYLKVLLICLQELCFGFDQSLWRGKPFGKSPYYRSFHHSADWRVKDCIPRAPENMSYKNIITIYFHIWT